MTGESDPPRSGANLGSAGSAGRQTVAIGRGENRGRTITYANVVRGMTRIGDWTGGAGPLRGAARASPAGEADGYVVLLQESRRAEAGLDPRRRERPRPLTGSLTSRKSVELIQLQVTMTLLGSSSVSSSRGGACSARMAGGAVHGCDQSLSAARPALMRLDQFRDRFAPDRGIDPVGDAGIGEDLRVVLGGRHDRSARRCAPGSA